MLFRSGNTTFQVTRRLRASTTFDYSQIEQQTFESAPLSLRNSVAEFHHELDHQVFASTDDPALDGGPFGRRFPGDHFHCACRWSPVIG